MRLAPGTEHWLRLEALTPANLGSSAGEATLDRPTQKEAWHGLPFVPDSALKGVLAGCLGDVTPDAANLPREAVWGSPDRAGSPGRPAVASLGNGEMLTYPLILPEVGRAWIFPAATLALLLATRGEEAVDQDFAAALAELERDRQRRRCLLVAGPAAAGRVLGFTPQPLRRRSDAALWIARWTGTPVSETEAWVVTGASLAGALWRRAAELRTLTALDRLRRTVQARSLRQVELIPPGTLFLSRVTSFERSTPVEVSDLIQLGAWESLGLGWTAVSLAPAPAAPASPARPASPPVADTRPGRPPLDEAAAIRAAHRAVTAIAARPCFARPARSAVRGFGPRAFYGGLAAALAFELAKAKPAHAQPKAESVARRWLLTCLRGEDPDLDTLASGPCHRLVAWAAAGGLTAEEPDRALLLTRWDWLRRFAELALAGSREP